MYFSEAFTPVKKRALVKVRLKIVILLNINIIKDNGCLFLYIF